ncbi:hypothetical protein PRK78_005712 [Emydomyces testavorans]|uniref:Uncharacterized protein n=1 Tax=Emydomyces testavorans TaxID=2070801 RepID=A0AAF0DKB1_9EURO|nr:hypothetical protein PRK78_005712 [Emydomyces testavorans]
MVFHLDANGLGMGLNKYDYQPWKLTEMKDVLHKWQTYIEDFRDIDALGYYAEAKEQSASGVDPGKHEQVWGGTMRDSLCSGTTRRRQGARPVPRDQREAADGRSTERANVLAAGAGEEHRDVLIHGEFCMLDYDNNAVMCYTKTRPELARQAVVVLNFTQETQVFPAEVLEAMEEMVLVMRNYDDGDVTLLPFEGGVSLNGIAVTGGEETCNSVRAGTIPPGTGIVRCSRMLIGWKTGMKQSAHVT